MRTGMNLLSKFCIAVSATQKLNCVAVGVICVAVFLVCFGEKNSVELRDAFPAQPVQGIKYFGGKKTDCPSAAAMKWSDVKHSCNPLRKHSSLVAPQITISFFKVLLEVPSDQQKRFPQITISFFKALLKVPSDQQKRYIFCNSRSNEEFSCTVAKISATDLEYFSKSNRLFSLHRLQRPN